IESPGVAEKGLVAVIVPLVLADEAAGLLIDAPAGESAGRLLDVALAVLALAQGEQLQELAGKVLVGLACHAACAVEIDQHRGSARTWLEQRRVVAARLAAEQCVLTEQGRRVVHFLEG